MPKIMLINVTHPEESRVAIIKDGVLEAFEIESLNREQLKGNIYKGVVHRIHPALEAAFVNIGGDRDAFLPLDEICFRNLPRPVAAQGNGSGSKNGHRRRRIRDILRTGEELVVQITKEPHGTKPATVTTFYSLPGRYLVLLPGTEEAGISRRIEGDERVRLRKLVNELQPPQGFGLIVRTAAGFDENDNELERDLSYLCRLWRNVEQAAEQKRAPALVYREHDIVLRTIRDFFAPDIDEIHIDNEELYERAKEFLRELMPGQEHVLHLYEGEQPIFSAFDVETAFESIFKRRVPLPSGGSIVIDPTEALTAIDVNSGGSVRGPNPEETAFRTNLEAATESCRQMRLRDIGGLIVIDFIDMREPGHLHEVERTVKDTMRLDKARYEVGRISRFGLMEISRQRLRPEAMATSYTTCAMCEGHGAVRTTESAALVALRKSHNRIAQGDVARLRLTLPNEVALYVLNHKRDALAQLEARYDSQIQVCLSDRLMPHQIEVDVVTRAPLREKPALPLPGTVAAADEPETGDEGAGAEQVPTQKAAANGENGNDKKRRRRRGRRRGRGGLKAAIAMGEALAGLGVAAGWTTNAVAENGGDETDESVAAELQAPANESRREDLPPVTSQGAVTVEDVELRQHTPVDEDSVVTPPRSSEVELDTTPAEISRVGESAAEVPQSEVTVSGGETPRAQAAEEAPVHGAQRSRSRRPSRRGHGAGRRRSAATAVGPTPVPREATGITPVAITVDEARPAVTQVQPIQAADEPAAAPAKRPRAAAGRGRATRKPTAAALPAGGAGEGSKSRTRGAGKPVGSAKKPSARRTMQARAHEQEKNPEAGDAASPKGKRRKSPARVDE